MNFNLIHFFFFLRTRIWRRGRRRYPSFQEAMAACKGGTYENKKLCLVVAEKTRILRSSVNQSAQRHTSASQAIDDYLNTQPGEEINVLDFGGACGAHYFEARALLPLRLRVNWYVVETPAMVKAARLSGLENEELSFHTSVTEVTSRVNILFSSGTLQYVATPLSVLRELIGLRADKMIFDRMMFSLGNEEIVTVQTSLLSSNGPGRLPPGFKDTLISYPYTTLPLKQFDDTLVKGGYLLESSVEEKSGIFRIPREKLAGRKLIYKRNS